MKHLLQFVIALVLLCVPTGLMAAEGNADFENEATSSAAWRRAP